MKEEITISITADVPEMQTGLTGIDTGDNFMLMIFIGTAIAAATVMYIAIITRKGKPGGRHRRKNGVCRRRKRR